MTLLDLSKKYGSNKLYHEFEIFYDKTFSDIRNDVKNVLEIGIWEGNSLKMWRDYFPNATIYGIDVYLNRSNKNLEGEKRIVAKECNASNKKDILKFLDSIGNIKFDIIIDDGSHKMSHQQKSFGYLFDSVKSNGFYCIEDLHTSLVIDKKLMERWEVDVDRQNTTHTMLKNYQSFGQMKSKYLSQNELINLNNKILSCEIYEGKHLGVGSLTSAIKKK